MTDEILEAYEFDLENLMLIPSDGGRFEVEVNGDLVYSKLQTKRHAEVGEIPLLIRKYLKKQ